MTFSKLTEQYYDWLYKIVCGEWEPRNLSFHRLLMFLYNRRFIPACEMDVCRATDGSNLSQSIVGTDLQRRMIFRMRRSMRHSAVSHAVCWK